MKRNLIGLTGLLGLLAIAGCANGAQWNGHGNGGTSGINVAVGVGSDGQGGSGGQIQGADGCDPDQKPKLEVCDGFDNDCDGVVDQGNPGGGVVCDSTLLGACATGYTECQDGVLHCLPILAPESEICDNIDNNCDGVVDEGNPGGGQSCVTGLLGECANGTMVCTDGMLACVGLPPTPEVCDGYDNDCDGLIDEESFAETCGVGACVNVVPTCIEGVPQPVCVPKEPQPEVCANGIDEDCDDEVDNGPDYQCGEFHPGGVAGGQIYPPYWTNLVYVLCQNPCPPGKVKAN